MKTFLNQRLSALDSMRLGGKSGGHKGVCCELRAKGGVWVGEAGKGVGR